MSTPSPTPRPRPRRRHPAAGARRIVGIGSAAAMVALTAGLAATSAAADQATPTTASSSATDGLDGRASVTQQFQQEDDEGLLAWLLDQQAQSSSAQGQVRVVRPQTATRGS